MGLESRSMSKGSSNNRKRPYGMLLLLLALGAALLSVAVLHKLRERRVLSLLVVDQERDLLALQALLQKERERNGRTKGRLEDSRDKIISLTQQKKELQSKLMETGTTLADLRRLQKEMEATLEEKENQIRQITEKASESAESTNWQVSLLTQLLKQKEAEIERMRKQQPPQDEVASHEEVSSRNETWVKLETIVEDEGRRDESGSQGNQSLENIEVSQGSEDAGKQEGEGRVIEEPQPQGTESTSRGVAAEKEESAAEDGDSNELEHSRVLVHEEKTGSESADSTTTERPKLRHRHRRRRGRRTKAKSRRRRESEKQDQEAADGRTAVDADDGKEELADGAVNEARLETATAIPNEDKASETMEIEADTKKEGGEGESEHEASKREVPPEGSSSGGNPQLPAQTGEHAAEKEEATLTEDDDDSEESNDHNPGKTQQEETTSAI